MPSADENVNWHEFDRWLAQEMEKYRKEMDAGGRDIAQIIIPIYKPLREELGRIDASFIVSTLLFLMIITPPPPSDEPDEV